MARTPDGCTYTIRRAGTGADGRPLPTEGYGDTTEVCGRPGREVPRWYWLKRPGLTNQADRVEGTTVRCPEHEES